MKTVSLYRPMNVVDQLFNSFFDSPLAPVLGETGLSKLPLVDVLETADAYIVEAELPGFDEKQIEVHMEGGKLTIGTVKEEKKEERKEEKDGNYLIRERRNVSFSRSFTLPENADTEAVSASFKNGVLSLEVKKRTGNARRLIQIQSH